jgi:4-hydroxy-tetrahydrodipicolinate reductase
VRAWVEQRGAAVVYGANFAPGVQLLLLLAKQAGRLFAGRTEFDGFILEAHHRQKRDAPSGTALRLREAVRSADSSREYPVTSIRAGFVPGTHALSYDSPDETLTLRHEVRSRRVFAAGALVAAEWIVSRRGLFEVGEVIRESGRIGSPGQQGQEGEERQERQRRQERQNRQRRQ